jgi:hypothetical protein
LVTCRKLAKPTSKFILEHSFRYGFLRTVDIELRFDNGHEACLENLLRKLELLPHDLLNAITPPPS